MSSDGNYTSISSPGGSSSGEAQSPGNSTGAAAHGPPYPPTGAVVGGVPTTSVDDPISAILAVLFIFAAAVHMGIFQYNRKNNHLFVFSAMMFAFCLIRAAALIMRMVWASHIQNVQVAIASNILTQAGTLIVFVVNLYFAQRIVRAYHPNFGWSTKARVAFRFLVGSTIACLIMVIAVTVQSFFTLDESVKNIDRIVQLFAGTYLVVLALIPILIVTIAALVRREHQVEKFGEGSWTAKLVLILFTSALLTTGAGFRVGTNFGSRPFNNPAWYHSNSAGFYVFNFVIDLIVAYTYIATAFHKRFHIPNGAKGPGAYTVLNSATASEKMSRPASGHSMAKKPRQVNKCFSESQTLHNELDIRLSDIRLSYVPDLPPGVHAYMRYVDEYDQGTLNYAGDTDVESHMGIERAGLMENQSPIREHNSVHWSDTLSAPAMPERAFERQLRGNPNGHVLKCEGSDIPLIRLPQDDGSIYGDDRSGRARIIRSAPGSSSGSVRESFKTRDPRRKSGL